LFHTVAAVGLRLVPYDVIYIGIWVSILLNYWLPHNFRIIHKDQFIPIRTYHFLSVMYDVLELELV